MTMRFRPLAVPVRRTAIVSLSAWLLLSAAQATGAEIARWNLADTQPQDGEHLLYRLSYRGLFTSFIWKDLADIAFITTYTARPFQQQPSCDLRMKMSTENYSLSEMFHATRYEWHSTVDPALRRIFLVEESDTGKHAEEAATWVNWTESRIDLFRQRERLPTKKPRFIFDNTATKDVPEWEKDGTKALPAFLNKHPLLGGRHTPLIYDKSVDLPTLSVLLDPLSLIYAARWHDYKSSGDLLYPITYGDEIISYRVRSLGFETLEVAGSRLSTHKMEIQRADREAAKEQGFLIMWLSTDAGRVPVQFTIKSKLGRIKVHIEPASLDNSRHARHCLLAARTDTAEPATSTSLNRK